MRKGRSPGGRVFTEHPRLTTGLLRGSRGSRLLGGGRAIHENKDAMIFQRLSCFLVRSGGSEGLTPG